MMKKNMRRLLKRAIALAIVALLMVVAVYSVFYGKAIENEVDIRIAKTTTYDEITAQITPSLRSAPHRIAFRIYAKRLQLNERFRTG